jgi:3-hydroxyisobutyrate dehydrogenase
MANVAFLGLGVMGYPMAGHLAAKGGHTVTVYNRTKAKADQWVAQHGGKAAATPADAAKGQDIVFACVGADVIVGANTHEMYAAAKAAGLHFIDAPVSGGQAGAENGALTVMCGGDQAPFDRAKPAMDCFGRAVTLMGEAGSGQLTKMVNQICIAGLVQALGEGLNFGMKAGLDVNQVLDVISKGAAQSWQMENRGKTMIQGEFEFGFAVDWMRKDLNICLAEANRNGARLPVTALVDQFYATVQARGGNRYDTSALIHLLMNA